MLSRFIRRRNSSGGHHASAQASLTDQERGLHQRAHPIPQQDPIGREVDVGFEAGAIQEVLLQVQRLPQAQLAGFLDRPSEQTLDHRAHFACRQPMGKALHLALGGHTDRVERIDSAEPLIERIARQLTTEPAIVLLQQGMQDRAAQRSTRALLELDLLTGAHGPLGRHAPSFQSPLDEISLHAPSHKRMSICSRC